MTRGRLAVVLPRFRRCLFLVSLLGLLPACQDSPSGTAPDDNESSTVVVERAWHRLDLWQQAPDQQQLRGSADQVHLLRPLGQVGSGPRALRLAGGRLRALALQAGESLSWDLGDLVPTGAQELQLTFRPLGVDRGRSLAGQCVPSYQIRLEPLGTNRHSTTSPEYGQVATEPVAEPSPPLLSLSATIAAPPAAQEISVQLQLNGDHAQRLTLASVRSPMPGPCPGQLLWGSPALIYRAPTEVRRPANQGQVTKQPNILFLSYDALRADALGAYSPEDDTEHASPSPAFDRLAEQGDLFLNAFATFNGTNPSFTSMFSGLWGKHHGIYDLKTPLPADGPPLLQELLAEAGYETGAIVSAGHLRPKTSGLDRGFHHFPRLRNQRSAELATDLALDWLAQRKKPFFLWLHLFEPHTPHTPPLPYAEGLRPEGEATFSPSNRWLPFREPGPVTELSTPRLGADIDLYTGEVAYGDRQLARLLAFLESRQQLESTLIVVVADHGENLCDHDICFRHAGLWDSTLRVPLLIRWPGQQGPGRKIDGLVQTLDLFPTLLNAAGIQAPPSDGRDLRPVAEGRDPGRRAIYAEHMGGHGAALRTRQHLYFHLSSHPRLPLGPRLYDLSSDPQQEHNLAGQGLPAENELASALQAWLQHRRLEPGMRPPVTLSDEERESLRALGYAGN